MLQHLEYRFNPTQKMYVEEKMIMTLSCCNNLSTYTRALNTHTRAQQHKYFILAQQTNTGDRWRGGMKGRQSTGGAFVDEWRKRKKENKATLNMSPTNY